MSWWSECFRPGGQTIPKQEAHYSSSSKEDHRYFRMGSGLSKNFAKEKVTCILYISLSSRLYAEHHCYQVSR